MKKSNAHSTWIAKMGMLLALALVVQMLGLPQPVTGPVVNAILFLTVMTVGWKSAILLGILTPLAALIRGHLPPVMAPLLPFIMLGNILLVSVFAGARHVLVRSPELFRRSVSLLISALVKTAWLWLSVSWILPVILGRNLSAKAVAMMTLPQFLTALAGGVIAYALIRIERTAHSGPS